MKRIYLFYGLIALLAFSNNTYAQYSVGSYDGFAISSRGSTGDEVPLPISLLWFTAECEAPNITLKWATASETNNNFFSIERSIDGLNFELLGTVNGAGNSVQTLQYSYVDLNPLESKSYYRLKQTDFDGKFEYSNIVSANCENEILKDIKIYPNPVTSELTIETTSNNEAISFEIINSMGAVVCKISFIQKIIIQTSGFSKGTYIIRFDNGNIYEFKVIKE